MKFPSYNLETIVLSSIFIFFATIIFAHFFGQFLDTYMNVIPPRHRQLEGMSSFNASSSCDSECPGCASKQCSCCSTDGTKCSEANCSCCNSTENMKGMENMKNMEGMGCSACSGCSKKSQ